MPESTEINVARLQENMESIKNDVNEIKNEFKDFRKYIKLEFEGLKKTFVTQDEFKPVRSISYGLIGTAAIAVLYALLRSVLK